MTVKEKIVAALYVLQGMPDAHVHVQQALMRFTHVAFLVAKSKQPIDAKWAEIESARLAFLDTLEALLLDAGVSLPYPVAVAEGGSNHD